MASGPKMKFTIELDPEALCETWGPPLYVYDAGTILERLGAFRTAFRALPHRVL